MSKRSHIRLSNVSLDFTLYSNKSLALREMILTPFMLRGQQKQKFRALHGVNLEFRHGDRVALIGPNGAGKSTLLKVVCGIYPLTEGELSVQGRITPLIEMGASFHPELTGLENLYLNGAIHGFSRKQILERMPRILAFSEIPEKFLDSSIKYYSSGMQMRLAFSLATELEPEILILDEIFAGGDAHFVEKASLRMDELISSAHIMILVTHDLALARRVSNRCVWISEGRLVEDGPVDQVLERYERAAHAQPAPSAVRSPGPA